MCPIETIPNKKNVKIAILILFVNFPISNIVWAGLWHSRLFPLLMSIKRIIKHLFKKPIDYQAK